MVQFGGIARENGGSHGKASCGQGHGGGYEWADFSDYWTSGNAVHGGRKADWPAQLGALTVVAPRSAAEAEALAVALTGVSLAQCVTAWLSAMEQHSLVASSVGGRVPAMPALTEAERSNLSQQVKSLSEVLQPARERGPELEIAIGSMFAVMNVFTGDEAKLKLQVAGWCEVLGEYPLFAIRKAAKWAVTNRDKLPSVSAFIDDVRLAMGGNVLERHRLLNGLLVQHG